MEVTHWRSARREKLYYFAHAQRNLLPWTVDEQEQPHLKGLVRRDHREQESMEYLPRALCCLGGKRRKDEVKISENYFFPKTALTLTSPKETRSDLNYLQLKLKDSDIIFLPTETIIIILNLYITLSEIFGLSNQQVIFAKCMWFRFLKSWFQVLGIFVIPSSPPNFFQMPAQRSSHQRNHCLNRPHPNHCCFILALSTYLNISLCLPLLL